MSSRIARLALVLACPNASGLQRGRLRSPAYESRSHHRHL